MTDLIDTTEMYLRTIFELEEEGVPVLRARIAERLGQSGPTVSETVARMERDGLLSVQPNRSLELSGDGRLRAIRVMRKHRLAERLLFDVIGLEFEHVHVEACRWEHVVSERVERKIVSLVHRVSESPYGNRIPGLDDLGMADVVAPGSEGDVPAGTPEQLGALPQDTTHSVIVRCFGEPLQQDVSLMQQIREVGALPGAQVWARPDPQGWRLCGDDPGQGVDAGEVDGAGPGVLIPAPRAAHVLVVRLP